MKIFNAGPGLGSKMNQEQIDEFLSSGRMNMQLGSLDSKNEPNVHPVWYVYENGKIYFATETKSKKVQNIKHNNTVYFSIDNEKEPYVDVRGKGKSKILKNKDQNLIIAKKIISKYLGRKKSQLADEIIDEIEHGVEVIIEIKPQYFSACIFRS